MSQTEKQFLGEMFGGRALSYTVVIISVRFEKYRINIPVNKGSLYKAWIQTGFCWQSFSFSFGVMGIEHRTLEIVGRHSTPKLSPTVSTEVRRVDLCVSTDRLYKCQVTLHETIWITFSSNFSIFIEGKEEMCLSNYSNLVVNYYHTPNYDRIFILNS